jgi:hypothetical protein
MNIQTGSVKQIRQSFMSPSNREEFITPKSYRQPEKERDRSSKIEKTEKYGIAEMAGKNREIKEKKNIKTLC